MMVKTDFCAGPTRSKGPLLKVDDLKTYFYTSYGTVKAVDGVSLTVDTGEAVGVVGESGCGKSMTAFTIVRLIPIPGKIVSGRVLFRSTDLLKLDESEMRSIRGKEISMVFQDPATYLNPVFTIGDQIGEIMAAHGRDRKESMAEALGILRKVGMPSPENSLRSYPHELSGGMRQRAMIAMALSCNPSLLILDEPTTALDVTVQAQILRLVRQMMEDLHITTILITHDLGIVAELCDRIYVMYAGRIVEHGPALDIFDDPQHPYTSGLLKSALTIDEFRKEIVTIPGEVPDLVNPPSGCRFHPRCRFGKDACRKEPPPPQVKVKENHLVACWRPW